MLLLLLLLSSWLPIETRTAERTRASPVDRENHPAASLPRIPPNRPKRKECSPYVHSEGSQPSSWLDLPLLLPARGRQPCRAATSDFTSAWAFSISFANSALSRSRVAEGVAVSAKRCKSLSVWERERSECEARICWVVSAGGRKESGLSALGRAWARRRRPIPAD